MNFNYINPTHPKCQNYLHFKQNVLVMYIPFISTRICSIFRVTQTLAVFEFEFSATNHRKWRHVWISGDLKLRTFDRSWSSDAHQVSTFATRAAEVSNRQHVASMHFKSADLLTKKAREQFSAEENILCQLQTALLLRLEQTTHFNKGRCRQNEIQRTHFVGLLTYW